MSASKATMGNIIHSHSKSEAKEERHSPREEEKLMLVTPAPLAQHRLEQRSSRLWEISLGAPGWNEHKHCLSSSFGKGGKLSKEIIILV